MQSLTKTTISSSSSSKPGQQRSFNRDNREELELQYRAQADVITQLGDKVHKLIHSYRERTQTTSSSSTLSVSSSLKTTLIKLERDFDRVQKQADALTKAVVQMRQSEAAAEVAAAGTSSSTNGTSGTAYEEYQIQMQQQLQEDVGTMECR